MAFRGFRVLSPVPQPELKNQAPRVRTQFALQRLKGRLRVGCHGRRRQAEQMTLQAIEESSVGRLLSGFDGFSRSEQSRSSSLGASSLAWRKKVQRGLGGLRA